MNSSSLFGKLSRRGFLGGFLGLLTVAALVPIPKFVEALRRPPQLWQVSSLPEIKADFRSLKLALAQAVPGDTIEVLLGHVETLDCTLKVGKGVNLYMSGGKYFGSSVFNFEEPFLDIADGSKVIMVHNYFGPQKQLDNSHYS